MSSIVFVVVHVESQLLAILPEPGAPGAVDPAGPSAVRAPLGPDRFGQHGLVYHVGSTSPAARRALRAAASPALHAGIFGKL